MKEPKTYRKLKERFSIFNTLFFKNQKCD